MNLGRYFERIGFGGSAAPTLETLNALHERHVHSVPFENLDVQLGRPLTVDIDAAFDKIVVRRRGGWCYEQNGLFGRVLEEIGFKVERVAGAVMRQARGNEAAFGDHLLLLVQDPGEPGRRLLVDVGFGCSLVRPLPLAETDARFDPYDVGVRTLPDGSWRSREDDAGGAFSYDFRPDAAAEAVIAGRCVVQQSHPASTFVQNLVVQMRTPGGHTTLRGRVLKAFSGEGVATRLLESAGELQDVIGDTFGLDVPEARDLWPKVCARHEVLFGADDGE